MKRTVLASVAAAIVSSALLVSPAAAAVTPTSDSVLPTTYQIQPVSKSYSGGAATMGMSDGSKIFWCKWYGFFC